MAEECCSIWLDSAACVCCDPDTGHKQSRRASEGHTHTLALLELVWVCLTAALWLAPTFAAIPGQAGVPAPQLPQSLSSPSAGSAELKSTLQLLSRVSLVAPVW